MVHRTHRRGGSFNSQLDDSVDSISFSDSLTVCAAERPPRGPRGPNRDNENSESGEGSGGVDVALEEDVRDELQHPPKYAVVLLNDDYTTMEFVIEVLQRFFKKTGEEAMQIMLRVHQEGRGVAGVFSHDIAETKVFQVHQLAKSRGYPLHCVIEPLK